MICNVFNGISYIIWATALGRTHGWVKEPENCYKPKKKLPMMEWKQEEWCLVPELSYVSIPWVRAQTGTELLQPAGRNISILTYHGGSGHTDQARVTYRVIHKDLVVGGWVPPPWEVPSWGDSEWTFCIGWGGIPHDLWHFLENFIINVLRAVCFVVCFLSTGGTSIGEPV